MWLYVYVIALDVIYFSQNVSLLSQLVADQLLWDHSLEKEKFSGGRNWVD